MTVQSSERSSFLPGAAAHATGVPALLEVSGVTLRYKTRSHLVTAAERVSFDVAPAERVILLGPSGCGKSSLLKAIGGYLRPAEGAIRLRGHEVRRPGSDRGMVFQEFDQLLPWKTVRQNVAFALTASGRATRREADQVAMHQLDKVRLTKFADAYPHTLSGGMKQRVAIARCLALGSEIVLMDEPFAALDPLTRRRMQEEVLRLWDELRFTLVFVTHSISEAIVLATRILVLSSHPGRIRADVRVHPGDAAHPNQLHDELQAMLFEEAVD